MMNTKKNLQTIMGVCIKKMDSEILRAMYEKALGNKVMECYRGTSAR